MSSGGAPPAPDYTGAAVAQGAANVDTARVQGRLNNPNFSNPYGSRQVLFGQNGDPDSVNIVDSLTPAGQKAFDTEQRINSQLGNIAEGGLTRVQSGFDKPFDTSNLTNRVTNIGGGDDEARQRIEQGLFDRQQPLLDRQRDRTETQLANQGITRGSEAWKNSEDDLARAENDARLATIAQAGQEQSRLFGMSQANADLANNQRQSQISEQAYLRSLPLNELNALRTGTQVATPQFQQYNGTGQIQAPNLLGAQTQQYQAAMNGYSADQAQQSNNINAGVGTAASLAAIYL